METLFPEYSNEVALDPVMAYEATTNPSNVCLDEAMKKPDSNYFKKAVQKEWGDLKKDKTSESYHYCWLRRELRSYWQFGK